MADKSTIEWTDATWNPVTGCSLVSPGCTNCYAMKLSGTRLRTHPSRAGLTVDTKTGPVWTGGVRFNEEWLLQPMEWKKPRRIFVCAHGDLFHENVLDSWIDKVFSVMALCPQHTFQVLTKRPERMRDYCKALYAKQCHIIDNSVDLFGKVVTKELLGALNNPPFPNVWLGVSVEDQVRAKERIPFLLETPAAMHFISAEPLLGQVDLSEWLPHFPRGTHPQHPAVQQLMKAAAKQFGGYLIDWVIAGGESGPGARPMHPGWAQLLRDQCTRAGVAFFFKQWGEWSPGWRAIMSAAAQARLESKGDWLILPPDGRVMRRDGKKKSGRLLDGQEHNAYPQKERAHADAI